jgi:hypothetical protein
MLEADVQIDWRVRLGLGLGGIGLIAMAIAACAWGDLDHSALASVLTVAGGLLAGVAAAGGPSPPAGPTPPTILPLLLVAALAGAGGSGCGACVAERGVVSAVEAGLTAADSTVGDEGGEEWARALSVARGAADLGAAAVDGCELQRDGAGWAAWVQLALEVVVDLVERFGGAAEGEMPATAPPDLLAAREALAAEVAR